MNTIHIKDHINNIDIVPDEGTYLNGDSIEDVVLLYKARYPFIINGYCLTPSQFPFRDAYKTTNSGI